MQKSIEKLKFPFVILHKVFLLYNSFLCKMTTRPGIAPLVRGCPYSFR